MYQNRVAGKSITVVKSPYYYDKKDVHLSKIVFMVENDAAAAAASLKAGDLQALDGVDPTQLPGIIADTSLRTSAVAGLGYQGITINIGKKDGLLKPYSNVGTDLAKSAKLREAFERGHAAAVRPDGFLIHTPYAHTGPLTRTAASLSDFQAMPPSPVIRPAELPPL